MFYRDIEASSYLLHLLSCYIFCSGDISNYATSYQTMKFHRRFNYSIDIVFTLSVTYILQNMPLYCRPCQAATHSHRDTLHSIQRWSQKCFSLYPKSITTRQSTKHHTDHWVLISAALICVTYKLIGCNEFSWIQQIYLALILSGIDKPSDDCFPHFTSHVNFNLQN